MDELFTPWRHSPGMRPYLPSSQSKRMRSASTGLKMQNTAAESTQRP